MPDSVVAEIVRDVQSQLGRVQPAVVRSGENGISMDDRVGDAVARRAGQGSVIDEPPPAYKPRDG